MRTQAVGGRRRPRWGAVRRLWRLCLTTYNRSIRVTPMRDAIAPRMVCRYTDPDGNTFDCIVLENEGGQAYIQYRPLGSLATVSRWVNYFSLSVPR